MLPKQKVFRIFWNFVLKQIAILYVQDVSHHAVVRTPHVLSFVPIVLPPFLATASYSSLTIERRVFIGLFLPVFLQTPVVLVLIAQEGLIVHSFFLHIFLDQNVHLSGA